MLLCLNDLTDHKAMDAAWWPFHTKYFGETPMGLKYLNGANDSVLE